MSIGITIASIAIIIAFSVNYKKAIGGFLLYFLNQGFTVKDFRFKGILPNINIPPLVKKT